MDLTPRTDFKGQACREVPAANMAKKEAEQLVRLVHHFFPKVEAFTRHDMPGKTGHRVQVNIHNDAWLLSNTADYHTCSADILESLRRHTG
jgi:hypothetical protein